MKKFTQLFAGVFCALLLVTSAFAADKVVTVTNAPVAVETVKASPASEAWVLTLGGVGSTTTSENVETAFGVDLSIGRTGHLLLPLEGGLRQSIAYDGDNTTLLTTKAYADWTLLTYKKIDLFAGGGVSIAYGDGKPAWEIAPEAGVRYWLKKDVALVGRAEVPFDLERWEYKDSVRYFLGVQVKF